MPDDIPVYESILGIQTVGPVRLERDQGPSDTIIYVPDKGSDPLEPRGGKYIYVPDAGDPWEFRGPIIQPDPGSGSTRLGAGPSVGGSGGSGGSGYGDEDETWPKPTLDNPVDCWDYPPPLRIQGSRDNGTVWFFVKKAAACPYACHLYATFRLGIASKAVCEPRQQPVGVSAERDMLDSVRLQEGLQKDLRPVRDRPLSRLRGEQGFRT